MSPKTNYAANAIKKIQSVKKGETRNKPNLSPANELELKYAELRKKILLEERQKLRKETRKKVKNILNAEKIDIAKELSGLNILVGKKSTKEEINKLIKQEIKELLLKRKENKLDIIEFENNKNIIQTIGIIFTKTENKNLIENYKKIINQMILTSNIQFKNDSYQQRLFINYAIKEIKKTFERSENIYNTFRELYKIFNN